MRQDEREDEIEDTGTEKTTENIRRDKTSRDQKLRKTITKEIR